VFQPPNGILQSQIWQNDNAQLLDLNALQHGISYHTFCLDVFPNRSTSTHLLFPRAYRALPYQRPEATKLEKTRWRCLPALPAFDSAPTTNTAADPNADMQSYFGSDLEIHFAREP
jgi:hypothetical protein